MNLNKNKRLTRYSTNWLWLPTFTIALSCILPNIFLFMLPSVRRIELPFVKPLTFVLILLLVILWLLKKRIVHVIVGNIFLCISIGLLFASDISRKIPIGFYYYPLVIGAVLLITLTNHFLSTNKKRTIPNNQEFLHKNLIRLPTILILLSYVIPVFGLLAVDGNSDPLRLYIGCYLSLNLLLLFMIRYLKGKVFLNAIGFVYLFFALIFLFFPFTNQQAIYSLFSHNYFTLIPLLFAGLSLILLPNLKIYLGLNQDFFRIRKGPYELFPIKFSSFQVLSDLEIQELEKQDLSNLSIQALSLLTIKPQELPLIKTDNDSQEWSELIKQGKGFIGPDLMGYSYQPLLIYQPIITWDRGQNTFLSNTETVLLYCFDAKLKIKWMHKVPPEKNCSITFKNCLFDQKSNVYFILMKDQAILIYSFTSEGSIRWNKEYTL